MNKGASFDIPALNKKVAIHFAAEGGHVYACKALLELGADPMKTDKVILLLIFFMGNSVFHLSLELLTKFWKTSLKVA